MQEGSSLRSRKEQGFTIVEAMVAVATAGALAVLGATAYGKYSTRVRQSEAKVALAAAYVVETTYAATKSTFSSCLKSVGFDVSTNPTRYFTIGPKGNGSTVVSSATCGPLGTTSCWCFNYTDGNCLNSCADVEGQTYFTKTVQADRSYVEAAIGGYYSKNSFQILATGNIATGTSADQWSMDDKKTLVNLALVVPAGPTPTPGPTGGSSPSGSSPSGGGGGGGGGGY